MGFLRDTGNKILRWATARVCPSYREDSHTGFISETRHLLSPLRPGCNSQGSCGIGGRVTRFNPQNVEKASPLQRQLRLKRTLAVIFVTTVAPPWGYPTILHPNPSSCSTEGSLVKDFSQGVVRARNTRYVAHALTDALIVADRWPIFSTRADHSQDHGSYMRRGAQ